LHLAKAAVEVGSIVRADELMAESVAERPVEHLEPARFVAMKHPPIGGGTSLGLRS
jgi:hypothetical protein